MIPERYLSRDKNGNLTGKVFLWDCGPQHPGTEPDVSDQHPVLAALGPDHGLPAETVAKLVAAHPPGHGKSPEHEEWLKAKREYEAWHRKYGGPFKVELWTVDAKRALGPLAIEAGKPQLRVRLAVAFGGRLERVADPEAGARGQMRQRRVPHFVVAALELPAHAVGLGSIHGTMLQ